MGTTGLVGLTPFTTVYMFSQRSPEGVLLSCTMLNVPHNGVLYPIS